MECSAGAMGTLLPKLGELLLEEYKLKKSMKQGINDLKAELQSMQAALVKLSNVPLDELDPQLKIWASELRGLSYVIEDSLDSSMVRIEGLEPIKTNIMGFFKKTRNKITKFKARHEIASDIKDIESQIRKVKERYDRYKVDDIVANLATATVDPRLSALYSKVSDLVGVDKAIEELMKILFEGNDMSEKMLRTVSIVGFGGLGKTTLAKAVSNKLSKKFDYGGFITVGRNPDIKKVLRDILLEFDTDAASTLDERQLINQLRKFLQDKRYLIVIDDIWDIPTWEIVKCALVDGDTGSRIIVTTRIHDVAEKVGGVYNIKPLSDDNSKKLFSTRVWGGNDISFDDQSAKVSDKILRKCGGVPLSVITIASLLVSKRQEDWSKVYESIGFGHEDHEAVKDMRKILSFSYYDLPSCLKTCLLHLSIFPEDHLIRKNELIWMWIAEGFIRCEQGLRSFDVGEGYFNQLVNRSMIRLVEDTGDNIFVACRVHDMVLDLIRGLSIELNFVTIHDNEQGHNTCSPSRSSTNVHRLALHRRSLEHSPIISTSTEMAHVRSFNATLCTDTRLLQVLSFKALRVLLLEKCEGCRLEHLGKLVHLRYIGLVETPIAKLPRGIGHDLKSLQTLDVRGSGIKRLPLSVSELSKLMCLRADTGTIMMGDIGKLKSLEELQLQSVDKSPNFARELGNLTEMRVLIIHFDGMDKSTHKALVESMRSLRRIQTLVIWSDAEQSVSVGGCWEEWAPPSSLRDLTLSGIILPRVPSWMEDSQCMPHLSYLWLGVEVVEERDLLILGRLPSLCFLNISGNDCGDDDSLSSYTIGSDEFRSLKYLDTDVEIVCGEGALLMLQELDCPATVGKDVGFTPGNMPLLQKVTYHLDCENCSAHELQKAEAALWQVSEIHPNHPTLKIERENYKVELAMQHVSTMVLEIQQSLRMLGASPPSSQNECTSSDAPLSMAANNNKQKTKKPSHGLTRGESIIKPGASCSSVPLGLAGGLQRKRHSRIAKPSVSIGGQEAVVVHPPSSVPPQFAAGMPAIGQGSFSSSISVISSFLDTPALDSLSSYVAVSAGMGSRAYWRNVMKEFIPESNDVEFSRVLQQLNSRMQRVFQRAPNAGARQENISHVTAEEADNKFLEPCFP